MIMKFGLFNREKLIPAFGENLYKLLIESLKAYTYKPEDRYKVEGCDYHFINVPNIVGSEYKAFQFVIFGQTDEIITLGYYSTIK